MAHIEIEPDHLEVHLRPLDAVLALHGSLHIPYSHITSVDWESVSAYPALMGPRIGTALPGIKFAGTFFTDDGTVFYDFHDPERCLTLRLDHERYKRVVVQVDEDQDPKDLMNRIFQRIPHA